MAEKFKDWMQLVQEHKRLEKQLQEAGMEVPAAPFPPPSAVADAGIIRGFLGATVIEGPYTEHMPVRNQNRLQHGSMFLYLVILTL